MGMGRCGYGDLGLRTLEPHNLFLRALYILINYQRRGVIDCTIDRRFIMADQHPRVIQAEAHSGDN